MGGERWAGWVTGFAMVVLGAFWMFMWLIGSNGFSSSRWLADGWSQWKAAPLAIVSAFAAGLGFLCVSCFAVLALASA